MNGGRKRLTRRSVVVAGFALAGCVRFASEDETNSTEDGGSDPESTGSEGDDPDTTDSTQDGEDDSQIDDSAFADHMEDANGWDGSLVDFRGQSEVVIENGATARNYTFDPAGIRIDPGTTVVWEWVSDGHTVTHANGDAFGTEVANEGFSFEFTFEEAGTYNYQCQPHTALGQRGTVVVGDGSSEDSGGDETLRESYLETAHEFYANLSYGGFEAAEDHIHPDGRMYEEYVSGEPEIANWYENVEYAVDSAEIAEWSEESALLDVTVSITTSEGPVEESGKITIARDDGQYLVLDDNVVEILLDYAATNDSGESDPESDSPGPGEVVETYLNRLDNGEMADARQLVHNDSELALTWLDVEANTEWYVARDIDVDVLEVDTSDEPAVVIAEVSFDDDAETYMFEVLFQESADGGDWLIWHDPTTDVPSSSS